MFSFSSSGGFGSSDTARLRPFVSPSPRKFRVHRRRHLLLVLVVLHRRARRGRGRDRRQAPPPEDDISLRAHSLSLSLSLSLSHANASRPSFILAPKSARESRPLFWTQARGADASNTVKQSEGLAFCCVVKMKSKRIMVSH